MLPLFVFLSMGWGWEGDSGRTTFSKEPWSIWTLREKSVQTDHGPFEHVGLWEHDGRGGGGWAPNEGEL